MSDEVYIAIKDEQCNQHGNRAFCKGHSGDSEGNQKNSINKNRICERIQARKNEVFQIYTHCGNDDRTTHCESEVRVPDNPHE